MTGIARELNSAGCSLRLIAVGLFALVLSACATRPYDGTEVSSAAFLQRSITQEVGDLTVTAAVPDAEETALLTGLDLYDQGVQPVWLKVENRSATQARIATWSIDRHYFSPIEVAYTNRKKFSSQGYVDMERWFKDNGMPRFIPAGETRSGLVFTNLRRGTKGFNLVIFANRASHDFTFFVPLPGFVADFMEVDFANLYTEDEIQDLDLPALKIALEEDLHCCARDPSGQLDGGPFNVVLIGTGMAVRRAMLRGGWLETSAEEGVAERARRQKFDGRQPDAIFMQEREDAEGNERIQLHMWMSPWRTNDEPVWVGQVFYVNPDGNFLDQFDDETIRDSTLLSYFARESVMADIDSAQRFLLQNLWYNGGMRAAGFVDGVGEVPIDKPITGFGGGAYFTDGWRLVAILSEEPVAFDDVVIRFDMRQRDSSTAEAKQ